MGRDHYSVVSVERGKSHRACSGVTFYTYSRQSTSLGHFSYYANGGTWTEEKSDKFVLEMGGSGTSGMLRIKVSSGNTFSVIVGYHNYKFWCDAQVDL